MYLVFDTETTGLPQNFNAPLSDSDNWPRMVQIAWQLHDEEGKLIENQDYIIKPEGYDILLTRLEFTGFLPKWRWKKERFGLGFRRI
jgi:DNA polymerase-3 subunit alpha